MSTNLHVLVWLRERKRVAIEMEEVLRRGVPMPELEQKFSDDLLGVHHLSNRSIGEIVDRHVKKLHGYMAQLATIEDEIKKAMEASNMTGHQREQLAKTI